MKSKHLLITTLVFLTVVSAAVAAAEEIELHVFHFKQNLEEQWNAFTDEYTAQNPNITFRNEILGGGTKWQTILKGKFAAGEGPDIFIVEGPSQARLWGDHIADLSDQPWVEKALPFTLKDMQIDGQLMGMPVNLEGYGYIYNKDIFQEAGVEERPTTLTALREAAQKIKDAGYTPFMTGYSTWWVISLHSVNVAFAQQDDPHGFIDQLNAGEASMAENPLFQDWQNVIDLTLEYGEKNPLTTDHRKQTQMFASGQAAMIQQGVWKEIDIYSANPDANIGLLPIPLNDDPAMDRIPVGVPFYFVINKNSDPKVQEEAKKFLNFLVSSETGEHYITDVFKFIPAYAHISATSLGGVGKDILQYASEDKVIPWVFGKFPDGFAKETTTHIQAYIGGQHDFATALEKMDASWQELVK